MSDDSAPQAKRAKLGDTDAGIFAKCKWSLSAQATPQLGPHHSSPTSTVPAILDNVLQLVGNTPLVRMNSIAKKEGISCELCVKLEYYNPGGSVKDRVAKRMIEDAEKSGRIKPGDTLIEPSSGNTGIGLALVAAIKGYRCIITMPTKMSNEKVDMLKALGAEVLRTPTEAAWDSPDSHFSVAKRLAEEIPNAFILDQYKNPGNPLAHYEGTAEEIWASCDGKVDMVVVGAGTGGTITGLGRRLKELNSNIQIVGVDPVGSVLARPNSLNETDSEKSSYAVEGIGYDFVPPVLDHTVVDSWVKTDDAESFLMARRMIREEGLMCGGSCGAAIVGAIKACKELKKGQRCVVVLPDSVRNYMTKFLNDEWMVQAGYVDSQGKLQAATSRLRHWWSPRRVADLDLNSPITITPETLCKEAIAIMTSQGIDMVPVQSESDGKVLGVLTEGQLTSMMTRGRIKPDDQCYLAMYKQFKNVTLQTTLGELAAVFDKEYYALVVAEQRCFQKGKQTVRSVVAGVVTRIDLLTFISFREDHGSSPKAV